MNNATSDLCIAIDGGTTNTRARLVRGSTVLGLGSRNAGVRDVAISGSRDALHHAVRDCVSDALHTARFPIDQVELFCVSGMLTSNVGLHEVPHVPAPADLDQLARSVVSTTFPDIAPKPLQFVPGVKTVPNAASLSCLDRIDVMRGEECEAFGILQSTGHSVPRYLLLPGSHTKLLHLDSEARITASYTTMGGELMQALAQHTILANSVQWPPTGQPDWAALEAGARFGLEWGIARGGFAVRLADVVLGTERSKRSWFLVGLVVGNDWGELVRWQRYDPAVPVLVGGREPLCSAFGRMSYLARTGAVEMLDESIVDTAVALGAIAVVKRSRSFYVAP